MGGWVGPKKKAEQAAKKGKRKPGRPKGGWAPENKPIPMQKTERSLPKPEDFKQPGKPGGPAIYDPEIHPYEAYNFALLGLTRYEMAQVWGVTPKTVFQWQATYPDFKRGMQAGGAAADAKVAQSLYRRATGYEYETTRTYKDRETGEVVQVPQRVVVEPDVTAAKHWLAVRQPARWRDVQQVNVGVGRLEDLFSADTRQQQEAIDDRRGYIEDRDHCRSIEDPDQ